LIRLIASILIALGSLIFSDSLKAQEPSATIRLIAVDPTGGNASGPTDLHSEFPVGPAPLPLRHLPPVEVGGSENTPAWSPFPDPVPCETLVGYAMAHNREIQAARYKARALAARVPQATSLPDPKLMTNAFLQSIQTAAGPQDVVLGLSQHFPWFGKRALRGEVAQYDAMAAYARVTAVELTVAERVKQAYLDLYFVQSAAVETRRLQPRLEDVIKIAEERYKTNAPGANLQSVLQAQVALSKLKTELIKLDAAKTSAIAKLAATLHLPPETRLTAAARIERPRVAETADLLVQVAQTTQPELIARRREICRDRTATELASRNYWPDATLSFNWHGIGSEGLSPVADGRDAYSLGVGVNLPIYRKRLDAAAREARCKTASTSRAYAAKKDDIQAEIIATHAKFSEHDQILSILEKEILPRAGQAFDLSVEAYRTGRVEFEQLIDTYRTLLNYRIDYHRREALRGQAMATLERAVGSAVTAAPLQAGVTPTKR